ncbi:MAG TPA: universal stress protein, partial [Chroococcales cyanobacterium]
MKVLVPVEDYLFSSAIVKLLSQHHWPADTEFFVVNVIEPHMMNLVAPLPMEPLFPIPEQHILHDAKELLAAATQALRFAIPGARFIEKIQVGNPAEEILSLARSWPADLIVAGSHGHSGFNKFFLGSVSLKVVTHSPCSVLLAKPDGATLKLWQQAAELQPEASNSNCLKTMYSAKKFERILVALDDTEISTELVDFVLSHTWFEKAHF